MTRALPLLFLGLLLLGCASADEPPARRSQSPFHTSPAQIAMDDPCRYMGTFHKESRNRVEELASCHAITDAQWSCLTRALKAVDREFTGRCRQERVAFETLERSQRAAYDGCFAAGSEATIGCCLLSGGHECFATLCAPPPDPAPPS